MLSCCDTPREVMWLAATAAYPAVMLSLSPSNYNSQAATRLLYNISRAGNTARLALKRAGAAKCILHIISTPR
jgi:hypothetical protein